MLWLESRYVGPAVVNPEFSCLEHRQAVALEEGMPEAPEVAQAGLAENLIMPRVLPSLASC